MSANFKGNTWVCVTQPEYVSVKPYIKGSNSTLVHICLQDLRESMSLAKFLVSSHFIPKRQGKTEVPQSTNLEGMHQNLTLVNHYCFPTLYPIFHAC